VLVLNFGLPSPKCETQIFAVTAINEETIFIRSTLLHSLYKSLNIMMSAQQQYSLSHSISVNKATCEYTGVIKFNAPNANVPFKTPEQCAAGPPPPPRTLLPTSLVRISMRSRGLITWEWIGHHVVIQR
jgi:hypothetical protein